MTRGFVDEQRAVRLEREQALGGPDSARRPAVVYDRAATDQHDRALVAQRRLNEGLSFVRGRLRAEHRTGS